MKASHGDDVDPEDIQDPELYLFLKTVVAGKKKGRIFGYGPTRYAYNNLRITQTNPSQETLLQRRAEEEERKRLADEVDILKNLLSQQDKKIGDFNKIVKYLWSKQGETMEQVIMCYNVLLASRTFSENSFSFNSQGNSLRSFHIAIFVAT